MWLFPILTKWHENRKTSVDRYKNIKNTITLERLYDYDTSIHQDANMADQINTGLDYKLRKKFQLLRTGQGVKLGSQWHLEIAGECNRQ